MLSAFCLLLACQLAGEITVRAIGLPVPGPLLGMALLVGVLALAARAGRFGPDTVDATPVGRAAAALIGILGLLFVPAGAGVVQHWSLIQDHWLALAVILVGSTVVTLAVTVWVFLLVSRLLERRADG